MKTKITLTCVQKFEALLFGIALGAVCGVPWAQAQPANDQCNGAAEVALDVYYHVSLSTATTTNDPAPTCQSSFSAGVWHKFTPPTNGTYVISTCGSDVNTVLAIYTGSCGALSALSSGCNDNNGPACEGSQASVVFNGDGGTTYWILTGAVGATNGNLSLLATTPGIPIVMQSPLSQSICANESVTFDSDAFSYNGSAYQWQFNGANMPGKTTRSLTLASAQPKDAGQYRVVVTNPQGSVTSSVANLTVTSQPTIVTLPTSVNATPGSTVEFNVIAGGGGPYTYQWKRNGNAVANATTPTLLVKNLGTNSSGSYTVSIKNPCGTAQSAPVTLSIVKRALRIGSAVGSPGQTVEVPVRLLGSSNENHIIFTVMYESSLVQLVDVVLNENVHPNSTLVWTLPSLGRTVISIQLPTGEVIERGNYDLAWLVFNISENVSGPAAVLLTQGTPTEIFNPTGTSFPYATGNGMILISEGAEPPTLNAGTGLFEDDFLMAAPAGGFASDRALQINISDLGQDSRGRAIQVYNATGVSNNVPYLRINGPLPAGVTPVTIQYIVLDRQTIPTPIFQVQDIAIPQPPATLTGTPVSIPMNQMSMANGAVYLKLKTLPGRKYYIQYSSDTVNWTTSMPPITGNGGWLVWTDNGPPKTPSRPGDQTTRFYRAFLAD